MLTIFSLNQTEGWYTINYEVWAYWVNCIGYGGFDDAWCGGGGYVAGGEWVAARPIDWCKTNQQTFEVKEGQTVKFECGSNVGRNPLKVFSLIFYPEKWIYLKQV